MEVETPAGWGRRYRKPFSCFRWTDVRSLFLESVAEWYRHNDSRLGASLAFYTLFSLTPLLVVVVGISGLVFGKEAAQGQILHQIEGLVGRQGAAGVQSLLAGSRDPAHGILATAIGLLTLLFGASGVLVELRDALNTIWEIKRPQTAGIKSILSMVKERLFSFALILAVGFLLLVSLVVNAWIAAAGKFFVELLPEPEIFLQIESALVSFLVITGLFASIYKVMLETRIEWSDVLFGSAVTSLLFTLGKVLIGVYLGKATFESTYGAAASVVVLIAWVYYSSQVFFLGAEFTRIFAQRHGSHAHPQVVSTAV